jgi:glyceraldehyde 3-phosphate dehydrogenase
MSVRVAINGYGRIGRNTLRAAFEENYDDVEIVAINAMGSLDVNAHLTKYDTVHGKFPATVEVDGNYLVIDGKRIRVFSDRNPANLPWEELGVDVVHECTGAFKTGEACQPHLASGAKKVLISAPAKKVDKTIVYGVNDHILTKDDKVISNASCTTNCLAPMSKVMHEKMGIMSGTMITIHSYTNDQVLTDVYHSDLRRARSATSSIIPTTTGAASSIGIVIPELAGKMDGYAVRVPTANVSMVMLNFVAPKNTSAEEINSLMKEAADGKILSYTDLPLVSIDFNHSSTSCNFDSTLTKVHDSLVSISAYYDNEWGYSCRMLDTTIAMMNV